MTNEIETNETLTEKTVAELRGICKARGIRGMTKKRKDIIVSQILLMNKAAEIDSPATIAKGPVKSSKVTPIKNDGPVTAARFNLNSVLTSPYAQKGNKTTTTIQVSCGANTSEFPVVGKTVGAVQEFLKEVLNIDRIATGQINGKAAEANYILAEGDVLEFIKPAGRKG